MEERLKRIEARCKVLGWRFRKHELSAMGVQADEYVMINDLGGKFVFWDTDICCDAAERILSLHEPGLMVEIPSDNCRGCPIGSRICNASVKEYMREPRPDDMYPVAFVMKPGPTCKGGKFKLARWEDGH